MVEWLGDEYEFYVLALDRDTGDTEPYPGIVVGQWQRVGKAFVMYLPLLQLNLFSWRKLLTSIHYDYLYQNSFFAKTSVQTTILKWLGLLPPVQVILAPRGEFARGALGLKATRKRLFIALTKFFRTHTRVVWHATTEKERSDILGVFNHSTVRIAPNLPPVDVEKPFRRLPKQPGTLKIVFVARIVPVKNLEFALNILKQLDKPVTFDIYGPIEDKVYWEKCQRLISSLPSQVSVRYADILPADEVVETMSRYEVLFLPTYSENFGHSILEALMAGCLPLISDQTSWNHLWEHQVGWDLPLTQPEKFLEALHQAIAMDAPTFETWSNAAQKFAQAYRQNPLHLTSTQQLFEGPA
jgi:glycosyltransferase involved in cell wall biosynthesis